MFIGFLFNFAIWASATYGMFRYENAAIPLGTALIIALVFAILRNLARESEIERLSRLYAQTYGSSPRSFSTKGTGAGWAIGSAMGNSAVGGLVGAALDITRHLIGQRGMSPEQKGLHDRISGLTAWSPFHGVYVLFVMLAMSFGVYIIPRL